MKIDNYFVRIFHVGRDEKINDPHGQVVTTNAFVFDNYNDYRNRNFDAAIASDVAKCSVRDRFNRRIGNRIALGRAFKQLNLSVSLVNGRWTLNEGHWHKNMEMIDV